MIFLRGKHWTVILHFIVLFLPIGCDRKNKRMKQATIPRYEIHPSSLLPSDKQVTTFLYQNKVKTFDYESIVANGSLSVTVTACSSQVSWNMTFISSDQDSSTLEKSVKEFDTEYLISREGTYRLNFLAPNDTFMHIYVSTEEGGPQALKDGKWNRIRLNHQRKKSITIRWMQSLVDPQVTHYCLVLSSQRFYKSLCKAHSEQKGGLYPKNHKKSYSDDADATPVQKQKFNRKDRGLRPEVVCVGSRTHYTAKNLRPGARYYLSVFAINRQSHLTYPRGSKYITFSRKDRFIPLKDGVIYSVNLKTHNGKAVFKYNLTEETGNFMNVFVIPCGGAVNVGVSHGGGAIKKIRDIDSYGRIVIDLTQHNATKFNIRIMASNKEELQKISRVKVYATSRKNFTNPFPQLPQESSVQQYDSLRTCNRLTIGWRPSPNSSSATYCITIREIKEGLLRESDEYKTPNQCDLEKRFKAADFSRLFCLGPTERVPSIFIHNITRLKPGQSYQIQVTVQIPKGETLSYDFLYVRTRPKCLKEVEDVLYLGDYYKDSSESSIILKEDNSDLSNEQDFHF